MYQKPPQTFLGLGRSSALQAAAIEEAKQNARENPIAVAAVSAAFATGTPQAQNNAENLLDVDFDGAAPASMQKAPIAGSSGLEGLAGTPQRVASPAVQSPMTAGASGGGGMEDLMGMFGNSNGAPAAPMHGGMGNDDLMNGFASLDMNSGQPPPPQNQLNGDGGGDRKTKEDLLGLF